LTISGRDFAAILRDCSAPIFTAKQVTLAEVIANIVRPLGITKIRVDTSQDMPSWDKISVDPGDSAWDALAHSAEGEGLWPWFDPDGTLVVGGPDYNAPPVASLILREDGTGNNVEWFDEDESIAERYSDVTVLGQSHGTHVGTGKNALKVTVKDPGVSVYRPKVHVDHDAPNLAAVEARARKIISDSALQAHTLRASVRGHRTSDGVLWKPGQRVHVLWEEYGVDAVYFLMARRFTGGRPGGTRTTLTLKEDGVWILDAHPHSGRKHRRKTDGPLSIITTDSSGGTTVSK
jgi:prophage tail gpP-like protein